jgi:hypothetical protein
MSLLQKLYSTFDVFIPENTSIKAAFRELDRRGKFDLKKAMELIFILAEEIEELKANKK